MIKGCIFNIERFAVHDGPGIRDLIFMKGCPLRCKWCSNPESQNAYPEILFNKSKCIGYRECGMCVNSCPVNAIQLNEAYKEKIIIDRTLCNNCGECASICPSKAINLVGKFRTIKEIIDEVNVDIPFFRRSNGGITVSGGEPLFQPGFVSGLLKSFQDIGIYTTIETSGYGNWENMESVCKYADLILFQNVPELREEYEDVKVLSIFVNEPGHIYTRNKLIKTLDDFDGMKIRAPMDTASSMLKALGASPVTMPTGDLYLSLERGVVDGTLFNTANMSDWKLWEVVDYYTEAGFYNLAWFAVMNKKTWESLPEDVQDVIEEKYELNAGKEVGKGFDKDYNKNIEIAKEEGVEIYELPKEERNKWKDKVEVVHEQWVQKMEDKGLPGRKVLNEIKRLIEEQK